MRPSVSESTRTHWLWLILALYFAHTLGVALFGYLPLKAGAAIIVAAIVAITLLHASARYSWREILVYFALGFVVSNAYENLSILTGFPFGHYHYTDALGPKLFLVPITIAPGYIGAGYLAWCIGQVLLGA